MKISMASLIISCVTILIGVLGLITSSILLFVVMVLNILISFCICYYIEYDRENILIDKNYYKEDCDDLNKYIRKLHKSIDAYVKIQKDSNELINKYKEIIESEENIIKSKDDVIDRQTEIIAGIETINSSLMSVVKLWEDFHVKTTDNLRFLNNDLDMNRRLYNNDTTILTKNIREYSEFCNKLKSELCIINDKTKYEKDKLQHEIDKDEEK